nr:hypothetical protein [Candidatus Electrothrix aestuarii]
MRPEALRGERYGNDISEETDQEGGGVSAVDDIEADAMPLLCNSTGLVSLGFFEQYNAKFEEIIPETKTITTMFIHSRRWRENHNRLLNRFLLNEYSKMQVFLPNLSNENLLNSLKLHFDDGDHLEFFIV